MNFEEILNKILEIAEYPEDKREKFISTFYEYLYMKLVSSIRDVDSAAADKVAAISAQGADAEDLKKVFDEISENPKVKEVIEKSTNEVVEKLAGDIADAATSEQKQQILSILPTQQ
jgi:hypothetical protein